LVKPASEEPASPEASELNELVAACLSRMGSDGEAGLEALCREHPGYAERLRTRVRLLRQAGLVPEAGLERAFPERLGDFRLIERLGAGGMGVVYLAEQASLGRRVALKLIRPDCLYFPGARARFAREVAAVARLAHPGIVPVHVVGEESGIPFFAMELVRGASLEALIRELADRDPALLEGAHLLGALERLAGELAPPGAAAAPPFGGSYADACLWIAREVAQALEHAHERGVLHRDVKSSNVMLSPEGRALLVDFGLAASESAEALTRSGTLLGSLPYMAPEQIEGREAGRQADVYGLGVVLYELLVLRRPFEAAAVEDLRRQVLEARPARLRARVPALSRDVEAVVAAAMAPEPERRYASAADFARDLTRLLERRPVEARAAGPWLGLARWTTRHRGAAAALAIGLFTAVAGPLVFGYQQMRLSARIAQQRERADAERRLADEQRALADEQRVLAEEQRVAADEQRQLAEANLAKALEAVQVMLVQVGDESLESVPQMERVRRELLVAARRLYGELEAGAGGSAELRRRRADVGIALAGLDAIAGERASEEAGLLAAIAELEDLAATEPEESGGPLGLALVRLGLLRKEQGRVAESLALLERAEAALDRSGGPDANRTRLELLFARSNALRALGRITEAEAVIEDAIAAGRACVEADPDDRRVFWRFTGLLHERGQVLLDLDPARAVEPMQETLELVRTKLEQDPLDVYLRSRFCEASSNLGNALSRLGRHEEALAVTQEGEARATDLVRDFPTVGRYRDVLAVLRFNRATQLGWLDRNEEALSAYEDAVETLAVLAQQVGTPAARHKWAGALGGLGGALQELGRHAEALAVLERAIEVHRGVVAAEPASGQYRLHLGIALMSRGSTVVLLGRTESVPETFDEALPLLASNPVAQQYLATQWIETAKAIEHDDEHFGELGAWKRVELVERCQAGALRALEAAVDNGWRGDLTGAEWGPVRERPEFQALVGKAP
jgi:serine/threonine protein kinase